VLLLRGDVCNMDKSISKILLHKSSSPFSDVLVISETARFAEDFFLLRVLDFEGIFLTLGLDVFPATSVLVNKSQAIIEVNN